MHREEKSERSRRYVLDAALDLFSHRGYGATSVRDVADAAGVSTGNLYHHFPDKEAIFKTLLDELTEVVGSRRFPYRRALAAGHFPDNIEALAFGARESVIEFRQYFALIYVDVIEFGGMHIKDFYGGMSTRFAEFLAESNAGQKLTDRLRSGVSPISALQLTTRLLFNYFTMEILFNVAEPFGKDSSEIIREIADILRNGMAAAPESAVDS